MHTIAISSLPNYQPSVERKRGVLKEFHDFIDFIHGEWKSLDTTCKCNLCMDGVEWKPIWNLSISHPIFPMIFCANNSILYSMPMSFLVSCRKWKIQNWMNDDPLTCGILICLPRKCCRCLRMVQQGNGALLLEIYLGWQSIHLSMSPNTQDSRYPAINPICPNLLNSSSVRCRIVCK